MCAVRLRQRRDHLAQFLIFVCVFIGMSVHAWEHLRLRYVSQKDCFSYICVRVSTMFSKEKYFLIGSLRNCIRGHHVRLDSQSLYLICIAKSRI
jgi:hypothetical protein